MFWDNFVSLCSDRETSPNRVAADLKLSSGSVTAWKNGASPRETTLKKIADYFDISVDFLIGRSDQKEKPVTNGDELTESQRYLVEMVPKLSDDQAKMLRAVIEQVLAETAL